MSTRKRTRVADAFHEIDALYEHVRKLKFAVTTTAVALIVSVSTLTYIISQIR